MGALSCLQSTACWLLCRCTAHHSSQGAQARDAAPIAQLATTRAPQANATALLENRAEKQSRA